MISTFSKLLAACAWLAVSVAWPAFAQSKQQCLDGWQKATDAEIVYEVGIVEGSPTVVVDERTYREMTFEMKQKMVDLLQCAMFDDGKRLPEVVFISNISHKRLARWSMFSGLVVD